MKSAKKLNKIILTCSLIYFLCALPALAMTGEGLAEAPEYSLLGAGLVDLSATGNSPALEAGSRLLLAQNVSAADDQKMAAPRRLQSNALERWHKYLGYGTVLLAGITAATSSQENFHEAAAYVTAAGALSTVLTGALAHRERFDLGDGLLSKDNLHIALSTVGAALLTTAVAIADDGKEGSHSGLGVTGGALMLLGVIDIRW